MGGEILHSLDEPAKDRGQLLLFGQSRLAAWLTATDPSLTFSLCQYLSVYKQTLYYIPSQPQLWLSAHVNHCPVHITAWSGGGGPAIRDREEAQPQTTLGPCTMWWAAKAKTWPCSEWGDMQRHKPWLRAFCLTAVRNVLIFRYEPVIPFCCGKGKRKKAHKRGDCTKLHISLLVIIGLEGTTCCSLAQPPSSHSPPHVWPDIFGWEHCPCLALHCALAFTAWGLGRGWPSLSPQKSRFPDSLTQPKHSLPFPGFAPRSIGNSASATARYRLGLAVTGKLHQILYKTEMLAVLV